MSVHQQNGAVVRGQGPAFDDTHGLVHLHGREAATIAFRNIRMLVLTRPAGAPTRGDRFGDDTEVMLADGGCVRGFTCDVPIVGGVWLRPAGRDADRIMIFVPDSARIPAPHTLPPPPVRAALTA